MGHASWLYTPWQAWTCASCNGGVGAALRIHGGITVDAFNVGGFGDATHTSLYVARHIEVFIGFAVGCPGGQDRRYPG